MIEEWVGGMHDYGSMLVSTGLKELVGGGRVKDRRWTIDVKVVGGGRVKVGGWTIDVKGSRRW